MNSPEIDETHAMSRQSWVTSANGATEFPIQNLPLGVFSPPIGPPRGGMAIGEQILDLAALARTGLLAGQAQTAAEAATGASLNALLALGHPARRALRRRVSELLSEGCRGRDTVAPLLHAMADCTLHLPCVIGDYTDFYVGIHHAQNIGRQFRPDTPLLPNYKHVPIAYHGRASSVRLSGGTVRRPCGQIKPADVAQPVFAPSARLDYELELGLFIGPGSDADTPISLSHAGAHIAGYCLLNDWSARDIQAWEYQPLGPFLAKNFATTISGWIVTAEALAPFRIAQPPRPHGDPAPLPYLMDAADQSGGALDIGLEVLLSTAELRRRFIPAQRLARSSTRHMYWTPAQMVTHHTSNGCTLRAGDLLGTGTLSGPDATSLGSLAELSQAGRAPVTLDTGETRAFLHDGDEVILRGHAQRDGFASIGFGECRATIIPPRTIAE